MTAMVTILDIKMERFTSSEFLCCHDVFHQVSAESDLPFESRYQSKIFKMAAIFKTAAVAIFKRDAVAAIWDIVTKWL